LARCPECGGKLKWQSDLKRSVCQSCGLSLTQYELDNYWKSVREQNIGDADEMEKKRQKRKDWLAWYSQSKAEKEKY